MEEDSVLISMKKLIGMERDYGQFDIDLIININSVFAVLNQIGVGPDKVFSIKSDSEKWSDFIEEDMWVMAKTYMYQKLRLIFDPPQNSFTVQALEKQIEEWVWRLNIEEKVTTP